MSEKRSSLLLFTLLASALLLALFGQCFALDLEPLPAFLDVSGRVFHGHLLRELGFLVILLLLLLLFSALAIHVVLFDQLHDAVVLGLGLLLVSENLVLLVFQLLHLGVLESISLLQLGVDLLSLCLEMTGQTRVDLSFGLKLLLELLDAILQLHLFLLVNAVHHGDLTLDGKLEVLQVQLLFDLSLVNALLELSNLLVILLGFLSELVLLALVLGGNVLDLGDQLLLLNLEHLILLGFLELTVDASLEVSIGEAIHHLLRHILDDLAQRVLV